MKVTRPPAHSSPNGSTPSPGHLRLVERSGEGPAAARPADLPEPALSPPPPRARRRREPSAALEGPPSLKSRALGSLMELSDAQIVSIARSGDGLALEALYRKHVSFAIHLATRIEGSARDVEDVVHDAFIKAFARLSDLSDPGAFRSWLGSIVVFAVRSRLRRARLMTLLGLGRGADPVDLDSITSSDASPHTRAQLAQIYALLRTLSTDDRIAWTLRYVEGHELDVVAKLTGCSLATVKRRISRAQKFLEQHFVDPQASDAPAEEPGAEQEEPSPASGAVSLSPRSTSAAMPPNSPTRPQPRRSAP